MDDVHNGGELPPEKPSGFADDPYETAPAEILPPPAKLSGGGGGGGGTPPPPSGDDEDGEESGMLRMSFLEHLEELRSRIIRALGGFGIIFLLCIVFSEPLFKIVMAPGFDAMKRLGGNNNLFVALRPMENFSIIWMWTPLVAALFLGSPWIFYQLWAFVAPGLYQREKRWAVPFVLSTAGLFILGGVFAYFVAFRYALTFLFGLGQVSGIANMQSIDAYFDMFVDVMLGIGLVFEIPVIIFFLTLIRVASPGFLLSHSRYAILAIVIIAAIVTPTPDVFNLMLFAVPMCMLFFLGVFASYLLVLHRENRRFPWAAFFKWLVVLVLLLAAVGAFVVGQMHLHWVWHWPFFVK